MTVPVSIRPWLQFGGHTVLAAAGMFYLDCMCSGLDARYCPFGMWFSNTSCAFQLRLHGQSL